MERHELARYAAILAVTAREAAEELDAVREHPEVIDVLRELADHDRLGEILDGAVGDDPGAFLQALADGLEPFRERLMDDEPALVEQLIAVAAAVQRAADRVPA